ncbi:MAG: glycosyltransferase family 2 protein [Muribaculaceae bacterium]|nr:glycosyltransferase family 2 protein [Muribaculaceae bacterium]
MNDLVSIFAGVYNIESRYPGALEQFLESIRKQTYTNIEVILVDDGSTDNSAAICDKWAQMDNRFHVVRHDTNKTINKARETGFRHCTGQLVFNADPDDLLHPQAIEIQHALLSEHPDCQVVMGVLVAIYQDEEINFIPIDQPNYELADQRASMEKMLRSGNFTLWNKLLRRELLETIDWDVTKINDLHLTLQIWLNASKFIHLNDTTYYWIQRELSQSRTNRSELTIQKFDTLFMDWNRYIGGKHPEHYASFLYRAYVMATSGFDNLSNDKNKKVWYEKLNEFYKLTWNDYIRSDAPLREKAAFWWVAHFPRHKTFISRIKAFFT